MQDAGEKDAANSSFNECLAQYQAGKVAMWYDATVAAGLLEAADSPVKGKNGYALAPVDKTKASGWLWSWALAIPKSSPDPTDAWKYIAWATGPAVHQGRRHEDQGRLGGDPARARAPRPTRSRSTRRPPRAFAAKTLAAMKAAPINNPGTTKRPGLPGRAVRRHPAVPGRRQPVHPALLERDRRLDECRQRALAVPADRLAGDQVSQ